jgi:hypothetical protein
MMTGIITLQTAIEFVKQKHYFLLLQAHREPCAAHQGVRDTFVHPTISELHLATVAGSR